MKNTKLFRLFAVVNILCAVTVFVYYLFEKNNVLFNLAGLVWYGMLFVNMYLCHAASAKRGYRAAMLILPAFMMFMTGNAAYNAAMGAACRWMNPGIAVIYFALAALMCLKAHKGQLKTLQFGKHPVRFVLFLVPCAVLLALIFVNLHYLLVKTELTMTSMVSMMKIFLPVAPVAMAAIAFGIADRLSAYEAGCIAGVNKMIAVVAIVVIVAYQVPVLALPNATHNGSEAYTAVFGGEDVEVVYSVPKMVFGGGEKGYEQTTGVVYTTFDFTGADGETKTYELKYDCYRPAGNSGRLPVIVRMHGSGGSKGFRNNVLESEQLAANGYAVFDINYGNEKCKPSNDVLADNVVSFLNYLYENQDALNIDAGKIILSGGSRGGKMAFMAASRWSNNALLDIKNKVNISGVILQWGFMTDVFERDGNERIVSVDELNPDFPPVLAINTTHDGSVQGSYFMKGVLETYGTEMACVELRYASHGPDSLYYSGWGQMNTAFMLRFAEDMFR